MEEGDEELARAIALSMEICTPPAALEEGDEELARAIALSMEICTPPAALEEEDEELARAIAHSMEISVPLVSMPLEQQASSTDQSDPQIEARLSDQQVGLEIKAVLCNHPELERFRSSLWTSGGATGLEALYCCSFCIFHSTGQVLIASF